MIIDNNPILNEVNYSLMVKYYINSSEETVISLNGLLTFFADDIVDITNNIITLKPNLDIDWDEDFIEVLYTSIK